MKKILFAFFFLLFATQIVAQVEIPKLKSSDLEFLMSMNLLGKEDYLSFLKFEPKGQEIDKEDNISTYIYEYGSMSTQIGQRVQYLKNDARELIIYAFYNKEIYDEMRKSMSKNGYKYTGDDDYKKNGGLTFYNAENNFTLKLLIQQIENNFTNQDENLYTVVIQNF